MKIDVNKATLIKRYKRFLADVVQENGNKTTIHCANTGAMTGCAVSGNSVYYSTSDNKKRKYPFSWEFTLTEKNHWICVNTIRANPLVEEALKAQVISQFSDFSTLQREVKYGEENSKIDFLLQNKNTSNKTYIEVKSVTLLEGEQGYFPDAKTERGQKHLRELITIVNQGHRAVLFFAVLHTGINSVKAASHIDPTYADLLLKARDSGVEIIAYKAIYKLNEGVMHIMINQPLPVIFD